MIFTEAEIAVLRYVIDKNRSLFMENKLNDTEDTADMAYVDAELALAMIEEL